MLNQHTGSGVHRLLRQASIKWCSKFNEDQVAKDAELPIPAQSYDMDEYSVSQRKLKEAFKGIPRNEILDFLKMHSDTETMQESDVEESSSNPFGGPCAKSQ